MIHMHKLLQLGARIIDADTLNQTPPSRPRNQRFRKRQVVLRLVEEDGLVQDRVGDFVHAPADETHGALIALRGEHREDGDEDLVGQVAEHMVVVHGGCFCRADRDTRLKVWVRRHCGVVDVLKKKCPGDLPRFLCRVHPNADHCLRHYTMKGARDTGYVPCAGSFSVSFLRLKSNNISQR
jgi:hypothetical protein